MVVLFIYGAPSRTVNSQHDVLGPFRRVRFKLRRWLVFINFRLRTCVLVQLGHTINKNPTVGVGFLFMARPAGLEPATHRLEICCSIQLSHGRNDAFILIEFCAFFKSDFIQKNISVAGGIFECPERKERRKRNGHSKLVKNVWGPKVQRRENVGGSLNPQGPNPTTLSSKSNGLILLTNRNVIHFIQFVK